MFGFSFVFSDFWLSFSKSENALRIIPIMKENKIGNRSEIISVRNSHGNHVKNKNNQRKINQIKISLK